MATAKGIDVESAIVEAVLDYYEGWFDGDAARMQRALHPDLVKRSLADDGFPVETISTREMVDATADGVGKSRDPGDRRIVVRVDHVYGDRHECCLRRLPPARQHARRLEDRQRSLAAGRSRGAAARLAIPRGSVRVHPSGRPAPS